MEHLIEHLYLTCDKLVANPEVYTSSEYTYMIKDILEHSEICIIIIPLTVYIYAHDKYSNTEGKLQYIRRDDFMGPKGHIIDTLNISEFREKLKELVCLLHLNVL